VAENGLKGPVEEKFRFRGHETTRVDSKGRLKIPSVFRARLEEKYGRDLFVTSVTGEFVTIYPMPVWAEIEERLAEMPTTHSSRAKYLARVNYFGQIAELDAQGRVLIPARLRETAGIAGDVDVLGQTTYLEAWNHDRLANKFEHDLAMTDNDYRRLAKHGI
jgi:transcriptional regulator MraZ